MNLNITGLHGGRKKIKTLFLGEKPVKRPRKRTKQPVSIKLQM